MRIGLISDTHIPESFPDLFPQIIDSFRDVDVILHAGDLHKLDVVDQLNELAPIYVARGNGDDGSGGRVPVPEDERIREAWLLEWEGVTIGMTHYVPVPEMPPNLTVSRWVERFFPEKKPDVIIYGDTHVESIDTVDNILCINPGSPTYPHNLSAQMGTIGFLEVQEGQVDASIWQLTENGIEPFDWERWR
jgi:putative phosphoesterase